MMAKPGSHKDATFAIVNQENYLDMITRKH
jgi:hypothetical protein